MGVRVRQLPPRSDARGASFNVSLPFSAAHECHAATIRPGFVRGNHYHRAGRELLVVLHGDSWTLHFDEGEGTAVQTFRFEGAGAVLIEADPLCAHAVRNEGALELQLFVLADAARAEGDTDTFVRVIAQPIDATLSQPHRPAGPGAATPTTE